MKTKDADAEAFDRAIEVFLAFYAPDVVCFPAPGWVEEEVCHGHDGLRRLSAVWRANFDGVALEIHEVRDLSERLVILAQFTGRAKDSGMRVSQRFGAINSRLGDDSKVGEVRFFLSWNETLDGVGLSA
jgi:SnoaL-like protein